MSSSSSDSETDHAGSLNFGGEFVPVKIRKNQVNSSGSKDFRVKNIYLNKFGRCKINDAEKEMAGLMSLRKNFMEDKPLQGAKIIGCTPITASIAVLIETLRYLGAELRWCANNMFATQNDIAAALAESGIPIFGWHRQTVVEFFWCIKMCFKLENWKPNMILDDGGVLTNFCHTTYLDIFLNLTGIVEKNKLSIDRLNKMMRNDQLFTPVINISNCVTNSKFENYYSCKESIITRLMKCTNLMLGGKQVLLCGYGDVGKGCCQSLKGLGCIIYVTEIDPICALQACMDGFKVVDLNEKIDQVDIVITATGNVNVISREHMDKMKSGCILCSMSYNFDEIDMSSLRSIEFNWEYVSSQVGHIYWPDGKFIILLTGGHTNYIHSKTPSIITSITASTQILALVELYNAPDNLYMGNIYSLPKKMEEYVAILHLTPFDAHLTDLTDEQSRHMGVSINGPFKSEHYRY